MKKKMTLFALEVKLAFKYLPVVFAGMLLFAVIIVLIAFAGSKILYGEQNSEKMNIALVMNDDNAFMDVALSYVFKEEVVQEMCVITEMNEETAGRALQNGEVMAVIIVPKDFLAGILNGTNIPARIILADEGFNSQSAVFREMLNSAVVDIATAQSAVYAMSDLCYVTGINAVDESIDYLNKTLLMYALRRNAYYNEVVISDTGSLPVVLFYVAGGIIMLLMFSGIFCTGMFEKDKKTLIFSLKREGISPEFLILAKYIAVSLVYFSMLMFCYVLAAVFAKVKITFLGIIGILIIVLTISSMILLVYQFAQSQIAGALIIFMGTLVMMFLSGNIIPETFLPPIVNTIGSYVPTGSLVNLCGLIMQGEVQADNILLCVVYAVVFLGVIFGYRYLTEKREG